MTGVILIVETGEGLPDSNAYADLTFVDAHIATTPDFDMWSKLTEDDRKRNIITATAYIDSKYGTRFGSKPVNVDQACALPVQELATGETGITIRIKRGCAEYARLSAAGLLFNSSETTKDAELKSKSVTAGPVSISKTFATTSDKNLGSNSATYKQHTIADGYLKPYTTATSINFRTFR